MEYVYALIDPLIDCPFYVGITNDPKMRFSCHVTKQGLNREKEEYITYLQSLGLQPVMKILESLADRKEAHARERQWVYSYIGMGYPLTNMVFVKPRPDSAKRRPAAKVPREKLVPLYTRDVADVGCDLGIPLCDVLALAANWRIQCHVDARSNKMIFEGSSIEDLRTSLIAEREAERLNREYPNVWTGVY